MCLCRLWLTNHMCSVFCSAGTTCTTTPGAHSSSAARSYPPYKSSSIRSSDLLVTSFYNPSYSCNIYCSRCPFRIHTPNRSYWLCGTSCRPLVPRIPWPSNTAAGVAQAHSLVSLVVAPPALVLVLVLALESTVLRGVAPREWTEALTNCTAVSAQVSAPVQVGCRECPAT